MPDDQTDTGPARPHGARAEAARGGGAHAEPEAGGAGTPAGADGAAPRPYREMMLESIGGWRGMVDSGLPIVVFVVANALGGLRTAIWAAVAAGLVLTGLRLARRQTVQQAVSGFFGVAVAAFIASRTGQAKGFFLLGIWGSFVYAGAFLLSILARWPAVGVIWEYIDNGTTTWRRERPLLRVYTWTTLVWVAVFLARGIVQRFLYNEDHTGWLAFARLAMGYPLTLAALGITLLAVRRARALYAAQTQPDPRTEPAGRPSVDRADEPSDA